MPRKKRNSVPNEGMPGDRWQRPIMKENLREDKLTQINQTTPIFNGRMFECYSLNTKNKTNSTLFARSVFLLKALLISSPHASISSLFASTSPKTEDLFIVGFDLLDVYSGVGRVLLSSRLYEFPSLFRRCVHSQGRGQFNKFLSAL